MRKTMIGGAVAFALFSSSMAQAAAPAACITLAEARGLIAYMAPGAIHKLGEACSAHVGRGDYLNAGLPALEQRYAAGRDAAWPMARAAIAKFAGQGQESIDFSKLSDEAIRPLADEIITSKMDFKLTAAECLDAQDIAAALDPIAPDDAFALVMAIVGVVARKDKSMPICPREAAAK